MKSLLSFCFIFCFFSQISYTQTESFDFELFTASLENSRLLVFNNNNEIILEKEFIHPLGLTSDLDGDELPELLIIDSIQTNGDFEFILYVFNTLDSFYLIDSINSGSLFPYVTFSGEIEGLIIVSGNVDFNYLNVGGNRKMLPITCWKFVEGSIFSVNEELYEIFITENEAILSGIENFQTENPEDCGGSVKALITSAYINYLNAGESTSAENLLETFYLCDDFESFKTELDNIFYKEN